MPAIVAKVWQVAVLALLGICTLALASETENLTKCMGRTPQVTRYVQFADATWNLKIESSSQPMHQVISHMFKIVAEEGLSYRDVEVVTIDDSHAHSIIDRISGRKSANRIESLPDTMINLEVLISPHEDIAFATRTKYVRNLGALRLPVTLGWFIPRHLAHHTRGIVDGTLHWTFFQRNESVGVFDITDRKLLTFIEELALVDPEQRIYQCNDTEICVDGYFKPEICEIEDCALLLAPHYYNTQGVVKHIRTHDMRVKVLWLGENLRTALRTINETYISKRINKSVLAMSWNFGEVINPPDDFVCVQFQRCDVKSEYDEPCMFEARMVDKLVWSELGKSDNLNLYESLKNFRFEPEEYKNLTDTYLLMNGSTAEEVACAWIIANRDITRHWVPYYATEKPKLTIGGIFPYTNSSLNGFGIWKAADSALKYANKHLLTDYELGILVQNGQCKSETVMIHFIEYIVGSGKDNQGELIGILGPACSETVEPIAAVSRLTKTMVISYSAEGASLNDRAKYPYFFRTIGSNAEYMYVYLEFMKQMGWARVAALTEDGQKYTEYLSEMKSLFGKNDLTFIANVKFPRGRRLLPMTPYLEELKGKRAKIIIADINEVSARTVMCEAYRLKMTMREGYVWFLPPWLSTTWYNTDHFNANKIENVNCTTDIMMKAIDGYFSIAHSYWAPDNAIMQENITVAEWRNDHHARVGAVYSDYAGFAYDAVWTYALAIKKMSEEHPEALATRHNTTDLLVKYIQNTDFNGLSGRIKFGDGPSRYPSTIHLTQWHNCTKTVVGIFEPKISDNSSEVVGGVLKLNRSSIAWIAGYIPDDGREAPEECTLNFMVTLLNVTCWAAVVILNVFVVVTVMIMGLIFFVYYKRKIDSKMTKTQRYMQQLGLDPDMTTLTDLDKWEIPREDVVINRKLGQGAFGTVYGGEARIGPEESWVAVAVKTLKIGSTAEEKIDFLSEAEAMKRFDHKNIVRLLGLCTRTEPVYTIMEFMLYGDLKTFLLDRRHLVRLKSEEHAEVSSKKLTSMALDVARALSYLAEMKYVHRDVACRNCLVNASRQVKLGDFGMTRAMYSNDYYKFHRKGMLPIRWMAPESVSFGVFSAGSDIWSYGVLMYEMITFGSFPFQGMSNNQVLEYVKSGHTLDIPHGVKPQLEVFLKSCWNQESKKRPKACEIVEFLANNPQLISPCLDGPISSVEMEGTDELEMHLPSEFRKQSTPTLRSLPNGDIVRSALHIADGDLIQLEHPGPKEPLLRHCPQTDPFDGSTGYITLQTSQPDLLSDSDIDYGQHHIANGGVPGFYAKCN